MSGILPLLCYLSSYCIELVVLLQNRAHPSVARRNRLLELNSWSTGGGAVYLAIVKVYGIKLLTW